MSYYIIKANVIIRNVLYNRDLLGQEQNVRNQIFSASELIRNIHIVLMSLTALFDLHIHGSTKMLCSR